MISVQISPPFPLIPIPCTLESANLAEELFWSTLNGLMKLCMDCQWGFVSRMGQYMAGGDTRSYKVTRYGFCDMYSWFLYSLV